MNDQLNRDVSGDKLYNLSFIENICRNNPENIKKMLQTFINSIPADIEQIKKAHHRLEFSVIQQTAHKIKPVLSFYSIVTLEEDITIIEQLAKEEKNTPDLLLKIQKLDEVVSSVVSDIKSHFFK